MFRVSQPRREADEQVARGEQKEYLRSVRRQRGGGVHTDKTSDQESEADNDLS